MSGVTPLRIDQPQTLDTSPESAHPSLGPDRTPKPAPGGKLLRPLLTFALLLTLAPLAHADTLDDFVLTGNGNTVEFSLPSVATFENHPHIVQLLYSVPGTVNGVSGFNVIASFDSMLSPRPDLSLSYTAPRSGATNLGLYIATPVSVTYDNTYNPADPYNQYGTITNTFVPGSYDGFTADFTANPLVRTPYTLTVTTESQESPPTSPVPEPSTVTLLATGTLGLLSTLRRRTSGN